MGGKIIRHARVHISDDRGIRKGYGGRLTNVRIASRLYVEVFTGIRGLLDENAQEQYARESWKILNNQDMRQILMKASGIISSVNRSRFLKKMFRNQAQVYGEGKKNVTLIQEGTQELDKISNLI